MYLHKHRRQGSLWAISKAVFHTWDSHLSSLTVVSSVPGIILMNEGGFG